jgi:chemotaxis protein MotA
MLLILGFVIVLGAALGGFMMAGGNPKLLLHPSEFVSILGISTGLLVISSPGSTLKEVIHKILNILKGGKSNKSDFVELLRLLYEIFNTAKREGLIKLEDHIMEPHKSQLFGKYKSFMGDEQRVEFLCNGLKPLVDGRIKPEQVEGLMEQTLGAIEEEAGAPVHMLQLVGDSLPGIGIVAAVMGIINTMTAVSEGPEKVGEKVGAALTGTLLGVFLAYGFVNPTAARIKHNNSLELQYFVAIMKGVSSFAQGMAPMMAVEVARRCIEHTLAPSAEEMEEMLKNPAK